MADCALRTQGLTRRYGPLIAVDAVNLRVDPGEIYAFLGRNGAGKTTTIRMLLGLLRPDTGSVELLGRRVHGGRSQPELSKFYDYASRTPRPRTLSGRQRASAQGLRRLLDDRPHRRRARQSCSRPPRPTDRGRRRS